MLHTHSGYQVYYFRVRQVCQPGIAQEMPAYAPHTCSYVSKAGRTCGRRCTRPEGCTAHHGKESYKPCLGCDGFTRSQSGYCNAEGCYEHQVGLACKRYYQRRRLDAYIEGLIAELV